MTFLLLIGCFSSGSSTSQDDTATADTGWQDDFEWEDDGTESTGDDTAASGTESEDTNSGAEDDSNDGYTSPDPEDDDAETTTAHTYTVCLEDLDEDVKSLWLDAAGVDSGDYLEDWLTWETGQTMPCGSLSGIEGHEFEIDGVATLQNGDTIEFVWGDGGYDTEGELEMSDHGTACYPQGVDGSEDGVYVCRLPAVWDGE